MAGGFTLAGSLSGASTTLADAGVDILTTIGKPTRQNNINHFVELGVNNFLIFYNLAETLAVPIMKTFECSLNMNLKI